MARETINPSELEKALEVLPPPCLARVTLFAPDFLLSKILREREKLVPGTRLEDPDRYMGAWIRNPSKQVLIDIYQQSYGKRADLELYRISWHIEKSNGIFESEMSMTPEKGFDVEYWNKEPKYVSQLRQVLSGTQVPLKITANDFSKFGG